MRARSQACSTHIKPSWKGSLPTIPALGGNSEESPGKSRPAEMRDSASGNKVEGGADKRHSGPPLIIHSYAHVLAYLCIHRHINTHTHTCMHTIYIYTCEIKRKKIQISLVWCRLFTKRNFYSFRLGEMRISPAPTHSLAQGKRDSLILTILCSVSNDPSAGPHV